MNLVQAIQNQTMSSRAIAKMCNKRHDNVIADIRKTLEAINIQSTEFSGDYKDSKGRTFLEYNLPKRETLILVSGYSIELRAKIIDRWAELELKEAEKFDWTGARITNKESTPELTLAIKNDHEDAKPYHFSNELDMINRIVLGMTAKKYKEINECDCVRDDLTALQLKAITDLQRANTVYIEDGLNYKERKEKLTALFSRKHSALLIEEVHLINA